MTAPVTEAATRVTQVADGLCSYLDASPSPFHAVDSAAALLREAGFTELAETEATPTAPGRYVVRRGGSLLAWSTAEVGDARTPATPYRVVGAHTDSPNLRIKPRPDWTRAGWQMLGVEVYGGALTNSWLDRDLGLSGRVTVRDAGAPGGFSDRLFRTDDPVLRVSQLAIHLDRTVRSEGLQLNDQQHLAPHWGLGVGRRSFREWLAGLVEVDAEDLLGFDAMTHDLTPARRIGTDGELIASARLDNLATSYAAVRALLEAVESAPDATRRTPSIPLIVLFDHEEVGSMSERGAQSTFLPAWLERIVLAAGGTREDYWRALAGSVIASGDMAHATHPNYAERHEPEHPILMNGGPVLKVNTNLRYATDSLGAAAFALACEQAGVPMQTFVTRSDLPCGSTVGPMTSALTGATTVDFGAPVLSMHSTREICGTLDQAAYAAALAAFLAPRA
ncbi:M18 family aminopeptidase [Ornithinimicrobium pekingense]|uniref:M18 family aminopeptidase n=1 Tax=Ornithinimicrobium pekingense TaxID=384677 RepID=A0ABQ2FB57_9MICO|nr:M18 family aminopeptidase [Ornithinimicrobium pekingense]GGK76324.1 putative M18 family aminopeptidase 2 [Ornithinimicrobium pekingense]